ncbi:GxxExxY protein [Thiohalobacter sp.]|uniref:GxxExxY protein n=1 Tax=Thiohalobacter sp. TaxID=2025948 RepID=UPI0026096608|nr:GxxExxY protein [Thiohalobacter sp.]
MLLEEDLTYGIRGAAYEVYRQLGAGFLEKVYERALLRELRLRGYRAEAQVALKIEYKGERVGEYLADLVVEDRIILELKAQPALSPAHTSQLLNYLRASGKQVGLLLNFCYPKVTIKRVVC